MLHPLLELSPRFKQVLAQNGNGASPAQQGQDDLSTKGTNVQVLRGDRLSCACLAAVDLFCSRSTVIVNLVLDRRWVLRDNGSSDESVQ
jgi:hypothetical protein